MKRINGLSLFANVGIAETYLSSLGVDIVIANELIKERSDFYKHLYPNVDMVCGDITCKEIKDEVIQKARKKKIDFIIATPPCQGMSRHGKQDPNDPRNYLIYYAVEIIKELKPKYVLLENVTKILTTKIKINGKLVLIPDYIKSELAHYYNFKDECIFNADEYGVPQSRERCIFRLIRKDIKVEWCEPKKEKKITLEKAIGSLPSLDPLIREEEKRYVFPEYEKKLKEGLKISKWHYPPTHGWNHVLWMTHTPSGKTAFYNKKYYPIRKDGKQIVGRLSCYRRYSWDKPANTITQNNGVISSSCCVHPGRLISTDAEGVPTYSDARVLSIYELMIVMSLPEDWNIPNWASEKLVRNVIGEGVPPKLIKAIMLPLINEINSERN